MMEPLIELIDAQTYSQRANDQESMILVPVGATEQHGPHMPLGVDAMLSQRIAVEVASNLGALVAPALRYGYKSQPRSGGGNHRQGTISLSGTTLINLTQDIVLGLAQDGFECVVFLNGHYENYQFLYEGLEIGISQRRTQGDQTRGLLLSYWDFVSDEVLEKVFPDGFLGWDIEHGGVLETALMLHLYPELVAIDLIQDHPPAQLTPYDIFPEDPARTPHSGCLSSAAKATATQGELLFSAITSSITTSLLEEFSR